MINVSNEFRILMNQRTDFKQNAEITLADGTLLTLSEKDFTIANNSVVDGAGSNGIPLGVAICRNVQIEIMNDKDQFSEYDFFGAVIRLYLTFQLSESVERIEYGTFTVLSPSTRGTTVIITALDDMYKADRAYSTNIIFPTTLKAMYTDICTQIGVVPGTTSFKNDNFVVSVKPEGVTYRHVLGYIAMIAGGNARIDLSGRMRIVSYDFGLLEVVKNRIDGGLYSEQNIEDVIDGGDFSFSETVVIDAGNYTDALNYHILQNWKDLKVDTDDITITGISTSYEDDSEGEQVLIYGEEGYLLSITNPLISGKEKQAIQLIGEIMVGGVFRQFSGDMVANPLVEFMDMVVVTDRKGNSYYSFVTDVNFQFLGYTTVKNSATPALTNGNSYPTDAAKTLVKARELINKERTAREAAVEQLAKDLSNSSGLFMTQEVQADKSVIYYMHDKPTLAESMIIWKLTALAFGISTDGGKTYPYGFTVDGTTITRLLYAEGIDADYINTGAIRITDTSGKELFYADYDTKAVRINADNVFIGSKSVSSANTELSASITANANAITAEVSRAQGQEVQLAAAISLIDDKVELKASKGELSSLLSVESGAVTIKSNRFSWESTYSSLTSAGKLTATDVDLKGKISASSGDIGGFTIKADALYATKDSLLSRNAGVYVGKDGIAIGSSNGSYATSKFVVTSSGDVYMGYGADISLYGSMSFYSSSFGLNYIGSERIIFTDDGMNFYKDITLKTGTSYIKSSGGAESIKFETAKTSLLNTKNVIGKAAGYVGFFGSEGSTKKTILNITSTSGATAATNAAKINEIIDALQAYNLIG